MLSTFIYANTLESQGFTAFLYGAISTKSDLIAKKVL